jgi:hypothetical protein
VAGGSLVDARGALGQLQPGEEAARSRGSVTASASRDSPPRAGPNKVILRRYTTLKATLLQAFGSDGYDVRVERNSEPVEGL